MPTQEIEGVSTIREIAEIQAIPGFTEEEFAIFGIPDFAARMTQLKGQITPKLKQIGQAMQERLSETLGEPLYPHVAQHLRRSVNAPEETWVAFARQPRAYKPFVHLRVAIRADRVRTLVFVEDYADEKQVFAENLQQNAEDLAAYFASHPTILAYELQDAEGAPLRGHALSAGTLRAFAQRMQKIKGQHAVFGIAFAKSHPVLSGGVQLFDALAEAAKKLRPLYACGKPDFQYTYTPEPIEGIIPR
ncbi:MAG TPA: DUF1054 family protein [Chthonomonadaceae bacterium]|nr:DUF1054 family protein [Chthonomonadaceae bacterium]